MLKMCTQVIKKWCLEEIQIKELQSNGNYWNLTECSWGAVPRFITFINPGLIRMSGPALCTISLGNPGLSWIILRPTRGSCQCPMASPEERNRSESDMSSSSSYLWSSFWIPEKETAPMCSQGLITETNSQLAQCLLNTEKGRRIQRSGGCAAVCYFLKPATERQTEGAGEGSRPGLQNTLDQLNNLFGLPGAQETWVWPERAPHAFHQLLQVRLSSQPAHAHTSAVQLSKKVGCHSRCRGRAEGR